MASEANNNTALRYVCFVRFVQKEWQTSTHKLNVSQHIEKTRVPVSEFRRPMVMPTDRQCPDISYKRAIQYNDCC